RKRSRVTPDQLVHLERFFAMDRSPTAARRKEISELLGMQERQTQIWFQNRRAKAKLLDGKSKTRGDGTPPHTPPELQPAYEADLQSLLHESEPITIIPCYDLTIGTWRRIATQIVGKHDLVTYLCETRRCLVWFIHSAGYGFKMEIPFETVLETEFTNAAPGQGRASFRLSQPPQFFLEDVASAMSADPAHRPPGRTWRRCADWTEHAQATNVLQHDLVGAAAQLAHVLRAFQP
ncbi:homeobox domain-containing protein, partial [Amylostereum chailletii]